MSARPAAQIQHPLSLKSGERYDFLDFFAGGLERFFREQERI